jgi:hypothetical protein
MERKIGTSSLRDATIATGVATDKEQAAQFTAMTSGMLATVHLGLTRVQNTTGGPVTIFLYGDANGMPDNANQKSLLISCDYRL